MSLAIAVKLPLIFPLHPRAALMLKNFGFERYLKRGGKVEGLWATEPLGYLAFLHFFALDVRRPSGVDR
jgi:UDP-N-acetylglucosamine 2-epimerase (non-hydrolysing)